MAASSTDAYNNSNVNNPPGAPLFHNYTLGVPVVSVSTGHNNFWPADAPSNSTSPSSEHNWEADEEEAVKRKIYELKRQFHNGRYLIVRHLPREATEEDVRSLLNGHLVHSIQINSMNGTARVLLAEPEVLEMFAKSSTHTLIGQKVTISPSNTEGLLCVARLPLEYLEDEFVSLVSSFGEITYCFLMRSEKTGISKGYGFVEYVNKEVALHAKASLDGSEMKDTILVCEWLDPSHVTFASLHSTTLYVDCLPKDYRHMGEFRRIFSQVANPPYCQIAMMQGAIQNWGLVEFNAAEDAEETRNLLNGYKLQGQPIRVSYYVPGVRAINIYMKLLNDPGLKKKGALLPEPPTNKVFNQLKNLTKHNPAFAKSLQNIILTQIQSLQQKQVPSPTFGSNPNGPVIKGGRVVVPPPPPPPPPPLPNMPMHFHNYQSMANSHIIQSMTQPLPVHHPPPEKPQQPSLNNNAQAALIILLAAQLQQQHEQNSANGTAVSTTSNINGNNILSNPQVLNLLQTLVSQGDPQQQQQQQQSEQKQIQTHHAVQLPVRNGYPSVPSSNGHTNSATNVMSSNLKANFRNGYFKNGATKLQKAPLLPTPAGSDASYIKSEDTVSLDLGGSVTPLLVDILNGIKEAPKEKLTSSIATLLSNAQSLQHLLGSLNPDIPPVPTLPGISPQPPPIPTAVPAHPPPTILTHPSFYQPPPPPTADPVMSLLLRAADSGRPEQYLTPVEAHPPFLIAPPRGPPPPVVTTWSGTVTPPPAQGIFHAPTLFPQHTAAIPPRLYSPTIYLTPTPSRSMGAPPSPMIGSPFHFGIGGFSTPVGQKRKSNHFLPSPEPSPENGYVGQHSQGIGGHYPDSYLAKKKKKH